MGHWAGVESKDETGRRCDLLQHLHRHRRRAVVALPHDERSHLSKSGWRSSNIAHFGAEEVAPRYFGGTDMGMPDVQQLVCRRRRATTLETPGDGADSVSRAGWATEYADGQLKRSTASRRRSLLTSRDRWVAAQRCDRVLDGRRRRSFSIPSGSSSSMGPVSSTSPRVPELIRTRRAEEHVMSAFGDSPRALQSARYSSIRR
jgi:hypothetical protein